MGYILVQTSQAAEASLSLVILGVGAFNGNQDADQAVYIRCKPIDTFVAGHA